MIVEWYVGFHAPAFRAPEGHISPRLWFGHCEIWGYTADQTWVFIDPQGLGTRVRAIHMHDDVMEALTARHTLCWSVVRIEAEDPHFSFPPVSLLSCASVCGAMLGTRALFPATLRRKLLAKGATEIHAAQGRPQGQGSPAAGTQAV